MRVLEPQVLVRLDSVTGIFKLVSMVSIFISARTLRKQKLKRRERRTKVAFLNHASVKYHQR